MLLGARHHSGGRRAFTLVDVLVSIAVILVLVSLMLPAITKATETAHRVVCSSNVRQIGVAMLMYADVNEEFIPPTTFYNPESNSAERMLNIRVSQSSPLRRDFQFDDETGGWDGIGLLFHEQFLDNAACFFCPSHAGAHPISEYQGNFGPRPATVVSNYQYRGAGPDGQQRLFRIEPRRTALVADGMTVRSDYNHRVGSNVMRADLSVTWFRDFDGRVLAALPREASQARASVVIDAWDLIDDQLDGSLSDR